MGDKGGHCVQCLASPEYLNWLAQNRYFEDAAFLKYLDYLRYWKRQEYCTYITCASTSLQQDTLPTCCLWRIPARCTPLCG